MSCTVQYVTVTVDVATLWVLLNLIFKTQSLNSFLPGQYIQNRQFCAGFQGPHQYSSKAQMCWKIEYQICSILYMSMPKYRVIITCHTVCRCTCVNDIECATTIIITNSNFLGTSNLSWSQHWDYLIVSSHNKLLDKSSIKLCIIIK